MNQLEGESRFDVRRFRPNLLVDVPGSDHPFPEQAWVGKTLAIGSVTLKLAIGSVTLKIDTTCPRCAMTTHGFDDLPQDPQIMRNLVANSEGNLGIYASVVKVGKVATGDSVAVM